MSGLKIYWFGRKSADPMLDSASTFIKRLQKSAPVELIRLKESNPSKEADDLLAKLPDQTRLIALDEHGEILTTMAMYDKVRSWRLEGHFNATSFVIGGANASIERVSLQKALATVLTHFTPPICAGFTCEQLYRVDQIRLGGPPSSMMEVATDV